MKWTVILLLTVAFSICVADVFMTRNVDDQKDDRTENKDNTTDFSSDFFRQILVKMFVEATKPYLNSLIDSIFAKLVHMYKGAQDGIPLKGFPEYFREEIGNKRSINFLDGLWFQLTSERHYNLVNALAGIYEYREHLDRSFLKESDPFDRAFYWLTNASLVERQAFCHNIYDDLATMEKGLINQRYFLPHHKVFIVGCHLFGDYLKASYKIGKPMPASALPPYYSLGEKDSYPTFYMKNFYSDLKSVAPNQPLLLSVVNMITFAGLNQFFFQNAAFTMFSDCFYEDVPKIVEPILIEPISGQCIYDTDPGSKNLRIYNELMELAQIAPETVCPAVRQLADEQCPHLSRPDQLKFLSIQFFSSLFNSESLHNDIEALDAVTDLMGSIPTAHSPLACVLQRLCHVGTIAARSPTKPSAISILIGRLISEKPKSDQSIWLIGLEQLSEFKQILGSRTMAKAVMDGQLVGCSDYYTDACLSKRTVEKSRKPAEEPSDKPEL